jgi:hypothetical protein
MNNITQNVLQIISKHKSTILSIIYKDFNKNVLRVQKGILKNLNSQMIQLSSDFAKEGAVNIKFFEQDNKRIYAIYNKNGSELLTLKQVRPLNVKLRKPEVQKLIIKAIKPHLGKQVSVVTKKMDNLEVLTGEFSDMGIMDISLKPAPFFNTTERLNYGAILHIFDGNGIDIIDIEVPTSEEV